VVEDLQPTVDLSGQILTSSHTLTNCLEVDVRLAPQAMADGNDLQVVSGASLQTGQRKSRLGGDGFDHVARVVPAVGDFVLVLLGVDVRLPRNVQPVVSWTQILDDW
jgi:hypothetical protein